MSEENEDTTGYVLASDYAEEELVGVEYVLTQLRNGSLEGRIINDRWYAASKSAASKSAKEINAETNQRREASEKARPTSPVDHRNPSGRTVNPVEVTRISIPFGDVMTLTFQGFCASLIIAIPIVIIFSVLINS